MTMEDLEGLRGFLSNDGDDENDKIAAIDRSGAYWIPFRCEENR